MLLEIGAIAGIAYSWKLGTIAGITGTVIFWTFGYRLADVVDARAMNRR
jgi:hypothetical protein